MEYNGWRNKQTWCANLFLDVDYFYNFLDSLQPIKDILDNPIDFDNYERSQLVESLKEYYYDRGKLDDITDIFVRDLLSLSLSQIDYYEIAENLISDYYRNAI